MSLLYDVILVLPFNISLCLKSHGLFVDIKSACQHQYANVGAKLKTS